jgi:uncharacterized protein (DUF2147 family)
MILAPVLAFAQKDKIEGQWYNEDRTAKVAIYKGSDNKFYGKVVWLKEPTRNGKPKVDERNSNKSLRSRPIVGLVLLRGFNKESEQTYDDGEIYDPKNGKTYSCTITYRNNRELGVRGYIGISMIGRTTTFYRAD